MTDTLMETARENSPTCTVCGRKAFEHLASTCECNHAPCRCPESEIDRHYRMMTASKPKTSAGDAMRERLHNLKMESGTMSKHSDQFYDLYANLVQDFFKINNETQSIKKLLKQYGMIAVSHCLVAVADSQARNPMGMLISKLRSGT